MNKKKKTLTKVVDMVMEEEEEEAIFKEPLIKARNSQSWNICDKRNHVEKDFWYKDQPKRYQCNRFGHIKKDCILKNNQQEQFSKEKQGESNLLCACHSAAETKNDMWYLNSNYSNQMTSDKSIIFVEMDTSVRTQVKMGNRVMVETKGKGIIGVQTKKGKRLIHDVLYVPDLNQSLLSLG